MSLGYVILCHGDLTRTAEIARHWGQSGTPVVIHVDAKVPRGAVAALAQGLSDLEGVSFSRRFRCEWGTWSIVAATLAASAAMLARHPQVGHVFLASGACLPLRPHGDLEAYLARHPDTDFIESVTAADVPWARGGIDRERFTLRFPFAWKRRRRLFDGYVRLQRRLGLRRRLPEGLVPHLGAQWWCLTRATLSAILTDPRRRAFDRYFRRVWIPDESYFQSLARCHARRIESRSLTLSAFDFHGRPHLFYDDHLPLLHRSGCFVARKVWPGAEALYRAFLRPLPAASSEPDPAAVFALFAQAAERRRSGRPGLYMQSRFPGPGRDVAQTAAPYSVFQGFAELFEDFESWLAKYVPARVHGHLFAPERAEFAGRGAVFDGCLSDNARLRDYDPQAFLTNLLRNGRGERQCFQFGPRDTQALNRFMARDPNAQISVVTGAWAVALFRSGLSFDEQRREAARLQQIELEEIAGLRWRDVKARVRICTAADLLAAPAEHLREILREIAPEGLRGLGDLPEPVDLSGFDAFLKRLRDHGTVLQLTGSFPVETAAPAARRARGRLAPLSAG